MKDLNYFTADIIDELISNRYAEYRSGIFHIKMYLNKELSENEMIFSKYAIATTNIQSCTDIVNLFESLSDIIHSKVYFDLKYMLFSNSSISSVFTSILSPLQPNFTLSYIAKNLPAVYDGTEGLKISKKYVSPSSLRITSKYLLMYYFKKYLNQYIYKTESQTPLSEIVTFNDKYIIDGKYTFLKQYIENPCKPVQILNLFYTSSPNHMCEFINSQASLLYNVKYEEHLYEPIQKISETVKQLFSINNSVDFKSDLKNNFHKLYQLHC